ncbi:MAG: hypothetical protein Q7T38_01175 [Gallionella sp.]|nr:hypothetical protein [Gallionella sp.]
MADRMRITGEWGVVSRKLFGAATPLLAVCCFLLPVFSYAEELPDPTLPPASVSAPVAVSGVVAAIPPAGLQSIIIGRHRRAAIIDGQTVELGGRHGDAKLVEVNMANVVLRTAGGRQVLTLFPDVKITSKSDKADSPSNREKVHAGTHKPVRAMEKK